MISTSLMTVGHLMTLNPITVNPGDNLLKVKDIFQTNNIHHIPVVGDRKVVGMVSKNDFLAVSNAFPLFNQQKRDAYNDKLFASLLAEEIMTKQVAKVEADDPIEVAAGIFRENLFHALPVVNDKGHLIGIITTYDLLNYFFNEKLYLK